MSLYIKTGPIAVCDRCKFKMELSKLSSDPNAPGLRVCSGCKDNFDPYRLTPRRVENIVLKHPRPDDDLV